MKAAHKIEIVAYDKHWPALFKEEANRIQKALGDNRVEIHHIGSTSVPDLAAKPVIDIMPVVLDITKVDNANAAMFAIGYEAKGEYGIPFRRYFQKGDSKRTHNVHVFETWSPEIERHLKFRDWMRSHSKDRDAYALLKQNLAIQYPDDIDAYCLGKDEFISNIDKKTGFNGLRIVKALTTREWDAARHLRQIYFVDKAGFSDPDTWIFDPDAHLHFVLYQSSEIIGYAHLQLWSHHRAAMHILAIDEHKRNHQYGSQFLRLCEKWLKSQGYKSLHIESSPNVLKFYRNNYYIDMPFNDPDDYERSSGKVSIGKIL